MDGVTISINGRSHVVPRGTRLADLLAAQGVDPLRIAVERNRDVVPRAAHAALVVSEGDVFEVVQFVGGG